jgi:hypothetical protein
VVVLEDEGKNMENADVVTFPTASSTRFCIFTASKGVFFFAIFFSAGESADRFLLDFLTEDTKEAEDEEDEFSVNSDAASEELDGGMPSLASSSSCSSYKLMASVPRSLDSVKLKRSVVTYLDHLRG